MRTGRHNIDGNCGKHISIVSLRITANSLVDKIGLKQVSSREWRSSPMENWFLFCDACLRNGIGRMTKPYDERADFEHHDAEVERMLDTLATYKLSPRD